jgi:hypothetical protein
MAQGWIRLETREPGVLVSVTALSAWFIVLIYGRLTLAWARLWLAFFRDALLACKLLFDHVGMGSNNANLSELTMRVPRTRRLSRNGAKRRRVKVPLSSDGDRRRPAVGTLTRTRNLILAALRVWELKQGIRS